jgi:hypothetical protein
MYASLRKILPRPAAIALVLLWYTTLMILIYIFSISPNNELVYINL